MKTTLFPARIHILFARQADYALIIRRGPSKKVCTIGWDRITNTFTLGQWLFGRIYEERCDLSPDGKYFIYFALNGKWNTETGGTWTAISRTPYLKAIGLWGQGNRGGGGGYFISNTEYVINTINNLHKELLIPDNLIQIKDRPTTWNTDVNYYARLVRDGWSYVERYQEDKDTTIAIFKKDLHPAWKLKKICTNKCCHDRHQLVSVSQEHVLDYPNWEWADADKRGLYWAEKGKIFNAQLGVFGLINISELYDFNSMTFEAIKAPY